MAPNWRVTAQRETLALDPLTQQYARMVEVTFALSDSTVGKVSVPVERYNVDNVRDAIDGYVEHLAAVANLTSGTP